MYLTLTVLIILYQYISCIDNVVYSNYTLTLAGDDCKNGQTIEIFDKDTSETIPICNKLDDDNILFICQKNDKCRGNGGVVRSTDNVVNKPINLTNEGRTIGFTTDPMCSNELLCYTKEQSCVLPIIDNGKYNSTEDFNDSVIDQGQHVYLTCDQGYTWYWSDVISCIQMSDGTLQLTSEPKCVERAEDHRMEIRVNVPSLAALSDFLKISTPEIERIFTNNCNFTDPENLLCFLNSTFFRSSDTTSLLNGEYTECFETSILSLFLMGLETSQDIDLDLFDSYDVKPRKRETAIGLLGVRIDSLDIVSNDRKLYGILIRFYIFQHQQPLSPSVVTRVMEKVPRNKYDIVLESYCQMVSCNGQLDPTCKRTVPAMQFSSLPRPTEKCLYHGKKLEYAEAVPLKCHSNEYIKETEITQCLFNQTYYPNVLPNCSVCGGMVYKHTSSFKSPVRNNGRNVRGADCVWDIQLENEIIGQFYINSRGDKKTCDENDTVDYLKITEYHPISRNITNVRDKICFGNPMKLSRNLKIQFISNNKSEEAKGFTFYYVDDLPVQPWYRKYGAILIAAPLIVLFFSSLVMLGVYCDRKNRKNSKVSEVEISGDVEGAGVTGDQTSNGTYKPVKDQSVFYKNAVIDEAPITPQPRINNAVGGPERKQKRRRKKRVSPNKSDTAAVSPTHDELKGPCLGSWVPSEGGEEEGGETPQSRDTPSRSRDTPAKSRDTPPSYSEVLEDQYPNNKIFHSPASEQQEEPLTVDEPEPEETKALISANPKRKKRRKRKITTATLLMTPGDSRPLPPLNGGVNLSLSNRPLPNINMKEQVDVDYPHISEDLGVD